MRKTPLTLGVLCIVFGSVTALWKGFGLFLNSMSGSTMKGFTSLMAAAPRRPGQPDPAVLLFAIALIVIGVGMYKRQMWARTAAIGWSALALVYVLVEIVVQLTVIQ